VTKAWTWEQLGRATLRRQFPKIRGRGPAAVTELIRRVGPVQSQVARSPFVAVASRLPGATYDAVTAAYESFDIVRGSNLRGTVHTCAREQHPLLDAVTRRSMAAGWRNHLRLTVCTPVEVQAGIEAFATGQWRTPEELRAHLVDWLAEHETEDSAERARTTGVGRAFAHVHSAMIRRPLAGAAWDRQTAPGYRVAADVLGEHRSAWVDDTDAALVALVRQHLAAYGPANRRDIAWWSGDGLRNVDAALVTLADELTERPGPDGQIYYDLLEAPSGGAEPGVRLLPEFDAVVVGYDPKSRDRFLDPDHLPHIWAQQNGLFSAGVLVDGRLVASWRFAGSGDERRIEIETFPGLRRVAESDVADQVTALEKALDVRITDVGVHP
jgi:hypothetical protein